MGQKNPITSTFTLPSGQEVVIETGKLATQAHGSVVVRVGDTMLFASVVSGNKVREGQSFFPLSVDYQEKFAAAGKIPGNFFRREARLSDYEILTSRLVDRAIRPLFPKGYMFDTQVILNLISGEEDVLPDAYAGLAASAALAVSDIPFAGPLSEVRVIKKGDDYFVNPKKSELEGAELEIIIAATMENVMMVEGEAKECSEQDLIGAIKVGHEAIKVQCQAQLDLAQKVGDKALIKREFVEQERDEAIMAKVAEACTDKILEISRGALDKKTRKDSFSEMKETYMASVEEELGEEAYAEHKDEYAECLAKLKKVTIRKMVLDEEVRLDGRKFDEVRPIWTEVDYLPSAHGSAIFNRGETQALATLTLGSKPDSLLIDKALENFYERFILHYNFPALSVGETKPMRGPGRREVGHANLASRALRGMLPEDSPYTYRIVSDILESNGSSSMATVCAGSLAFMDAGIKMKAPVSGIAMGMIAEGDKMAILSDILGDEDALGDMDFKLTGTYKGITACQMDIKIDGLPYETLEKALLQAKEGREHILNEMGKTLSEAKPDLKSFAPRIVQIEIKKDFIGAVIGPGGKIIQEIQATTGAVLNIEEVDDVGLVAISCNNAEGMNAAIQAVKEITFEPKEGDVYDAVVATVKPFGVFVDFKGRNSGLVHVSELSHSRIDDVEKLYRQGDKMQVKHIGLDRKSGKIRLSHKALLPRENKQ